MALIHQINVKTQLINTDFPSNVTLAIEHAEDNAELLNDAYQFGEDIAGDTDFIREYKEQLNNTNPIIQALTLANVVDEILRNYGNALEIDFDLTNMSNLGMSNVSHYAMMIGDSVKNSSMIREKSNYMTNYMIVNIADYHTAQALSDRAELILNKDLKSMAATSNVTTFIVKRENGMTQLRDVVNNNASPPMDVMMIVHTQIHPNLQKEICKKPIICSWYGNFQFSFYY